MLIKAYYPVTLTIDGDEVKLRIKRMTDDEFADFSEQHTRVMTPTIAKVTARASAGREQERDGQGHYRLSFESLCMERLETMEQEEREAFMGAVKKDEAEARTFIKYAFETFLTVESGVTEETADGTQVSVTKGLDFLRLFGARQDVLQHVLLAIRRENTLDASQKKVSPSPSASRAGFRQRPKARVGRRRGTTASSAATVASVPTAGATARTPGGLSGSPETSAPRGARSVN